jgi:hypothetical protein
VKLVGLDAVLAIRARGVQPRLATRASFMPGGLAPWECRGIGKLPSTVECRRPRQGGLPVSPRKGSWSPPLPFHGQTAGGGRLRGSCSARPTGAAGGLSGIPRRWSRVARLAAQSCPPRPPRRGLALCQKPRRYADVQKTSRPFTDDCEANIVGGTINHRDSQPHGGSKR